MELYKGKYQYYYHNNAKSAHYIASFQYKQRSFETPRAELSQIEKINKRIMMMTTIIPPSPFLISFIIGINNNPNTNRIIKFLSPLSTSKNRISERNRRQIKPKTQSLRSFHTSL